jgi:TolB protein
MRADGTELRRLTRFDGLESWPAWHPDGKQLVVARNRAGQSDLVLVPADRVAGRDLAGETERYCVEHPAQDSFPFFSPDGRRLAFLSDRAGGWAIHTVDFPAKLAPLPARKPVGSP